MKFSIHPEFKITSHGTVLTESDLRSDFAEIWQFLEDWKAEKSELTLQTSGSTGKPKLIHVSKQVMWHSAGATLEALDVDRPIKALLALPTKFIAGKMMLVRAMRAGWTIEIEQPTLDVLLRVKGDFDFTALIPLQVETGFVELERFGTIIIGGAPVSIGLRNRISELSTPIYATYGMTETVSHIALQRLAPTLEESFTAVKGVTFSLSPEQSLQIHAPAWGHESLATTDVVDLLNETQFVWKGRADFVINSGGLKLHPEKIEGVLADVLQSEVYVVGVEDGAMGQRAVAILEGEARDCTVEFPALTKHEIPKEFRFIDQFPRTENGKINRRALMNWANS